MTTKREGTIRILPQSKRNLIGIDAVGKVSPEGYQELLRPTFLKAIDEYDQIKALSERFQVPSSVFV